MSTSGQGFPKAARIRAKPDIDRVFRKGSTYACKGMRLHVLPKGASLGPTRVLFVPVRSFAGAVQRNRAKRLAREAWRRMRASLVPGYDVAVVLFPDDADFGDYCSRMTHLVRKAGLLA